MNDYIISTLKVLPEGLSRNDYNPLHHKSLTVQYQDNPVRPEYRMYQVIRTDGTVLYACVSMDEALDEARYRLNNNNDPNL